MPIQFTKAVKREAKLRLAISGPSGSGKTYTALAVAKEMGGKVALVDTERGSASKYADEWPGFTFDVLELATFHPDSYIAAIKAAQTAGYDVLVIDSGTHEWSGTSGCLELVDLAAARKQGNKFMAWSDVTPLHNAFIEAVHQAQMHVIVTFRSKMDYMQSKDATGKAVISKVGMNPITREGTEYEYDIVGEMDLDHKLTISKSRARVLADRAFAKPGAAMAQEIMAWLQGAPAPEKPVLASVAVPPLAPVAKPAAPAPPARTEPSEREKRIARWRELREAVKEKGVPVIALTLARVQQTSDADIETAIAELERDLAKLCKPAEQAVLV